AVQTQGDLLEVVAAHGAVGRFPYLLDGRQQQAEEQGDDGDHHQQLDQREATRTTRNQHRSPHAESSIGRRSCESASCQGVCPDPGVELKKQTRSRSPANRDRKTPPGIKTAWFTGR